MRFRLFDSKEALARQEAFCKICDRCTEALAVLERMQAEAGVAVLAPEPPGPGSPEQSPGNAN
jgi:hypothetical protein